MQRQHARGGQGVEATWFAQADARAAVTNLTGLCTIARNDVSSKIESHVIFHTPFVGDGIL
jgi:hypothetical protein